MRMAVGVGGVDVHRVECAVVGTEARPAAANCKVVAGIAGGGLVPGMSVGGAICLCR